MHDGKLAAVGIFVHTEKTALYPTLVCTVYKWKRENPEVPAQRSVHQFGRRRGTTPVITLKYNHCGSLLNPSTHVNEIMKCILDEALVDATFNVYSDLKVKEDGVYTHKTGSYKGLHSVAPRPWPVRRHKWRRRKVKQAIASGRKKCGRWFDKAKKKYRRTYLVITVLNAMLNVSLYFLDIFTDVVLLVTFLVHGWFWSSVGSITFIALPYLVAMYGIVRTRKQALKDYIDWDLIMIHGKKYCCFFCFLQFCHWCSTCF